MFEDVPVKGTTMAESTSFVHSIASNMVNLQNPLVIDTALTALPSKSSMR